MSDLAVVLLRKFPNAILSWHDDSDIILEDMGDGQYIAKWNEKKIGPAPTKEQLADWIAQDVPPPPPTDKQRLEAVTGLTVDRLKAVLASATVVDAKP